MQTNDGYESEIACFLNELSDVQRSLLAALEEKRKLLISGDVSALAAIGAREQELAARLQTCHDRRQQILARADADGMPADSIESLSSRLPESSRTAAQASIREAAGRVNLLRHKSLTNWVVVQRSLLHLSQMIEIIATGGRPKPTYDRGSDRRNDCRPGGSLVDRAA